jgi:hypothetical protein
VSVLIHRANGLSTVLDDDAAELALGPGERLTLAVLDVQAG